MQPPNPFQEVYYNQNMTNFPRGPANIDVSAESSRKINVMPSDPRSTIPALTMGFGVSGNPEPYAGDSRGREHQCSVPVSSSMETMTFWQQSVAPCHPNERGFHESFSECNLYSSSTGQPVVGTSASSLQVPGNVGKSRILPQNIVRLEDHAAGLNDKGCESSGQAETSSTIQRIVDLSSVSGVDFDNTLGIKIGNSVLSVPEANNFIKNALRLLGASPGSPCVNRDGSSAPDSHSQSLGQNPDTLNPLTTALKTVEPGPTLDKPVVHFDKVPVNVGDELKTGKGGSALTEKLWDGTLKLSSSVSVPAVALFKSGEQMQDFSWSEVVEVKGKVRLDAFEKFIQDLSWSRTRGLMDIP